jgi:hypothetical protein
MEVGCEISAETLPNGVSSIEAEIHIPWLKSQSETTDLFPRLKDTANSKFIFNDSVVNTHSFDGGRGVLGILHQFRDREPLCILPVLLEPNHDKKNIKASLDLSAYRKDGQNANIYFRFSITAKTNSFSIRKKGVGRSTIIYDLKINELRNLPDNLFTELQNKQLCTIKNCFCFNIVPNSYDLAFFDSTSLRNVRTLEYDAFNRYLEDGRVQKDQLMVVFNKKEYPKSFAFFTIFTKERIGAGQFALAILINLISGILLFLPNYRNENSNNIISKVFWQNLPIEVYVAISIGLALIVYFVWPTIISALYRLQTRIVLKKKKNR